MNIEAIMRIAAEMQGVDVSTVVSRSRKREVVNARQVSMEVCRQLRGQKKINMGIIGNAHGGLRHNSVIHATEVVRGNPILRRRVDEIIQKVKLSDILE